MSIKIILGDNQFFGINHKDLKKGDKTKNKFSSIDDINSTIQFSINSGYDGFMINSNSIGYELVNKFNFSNTIHYSVPYPHKYANIVNEKGMIGLVWFAVQNSNLKVLFVNSIKFLFTLNIKFLIKILIKLELPRNLKKGSYVYLQNIVTDLIIGLNKIDFFESYISAVTDLGYRPGLITLNPIKADKFLKQIKHTNELILCFNFNKIGFNTFPCLKDVEKFVSSHKKNYKLMAMSVFASGGIDDRYSAINYIKDFDLDYAVIGSSKESNILNNLKMFKKNA